MADPTIRLIWEFETKNQHAEIRCGGCRRVVILPSAMILQMFNGRTSIRAAEGRLRCRHCGKKAARLRGVYREYHG